MKTSLRLFGSAIGFALVTIDIAGAGQLSDRSEAGSRNAFVTTASRLAPAAERGDTRSQTMLGFMYATGRGVPQHFVHAVDWYSRAAEQGDPTAQCLLGLMYDKGQGVPQNDVLAHKWLILAAAKASGRQRDYCARIRDAVAFKLTPAQISEAQSLADAWRPFRKR